MLIGFFGRAVRYIHTPRLNKFTHLISSDEIVQPTKLELETIDSLPFFKDDRFKTNSQKITKSKQMYLQKKLPVVKKIFKCDEFPNYLSYNIPAKLRNPYYDAYARRSINVETGAVEYKGTSRLSVTKLLTKRWCELREAFDIYSNIPIYEHSQVKIGKIEHQKLEDQTHILPLGLQDFEDDFELDIPDDPFHSLVGEWFSTLTKIVTLFHKGHAREIMCHGYLDSRTGQLVDGNVKDSEDILISGIVDHLFIRHKSLGDKRSTALNERLLDDSNYDLQRVLEIMPGLITNAGNHMEVIVTDVKTRSTTTIPSQCSVVNASKLQVMYYRRFLETLGRDPEVTYNNLLINAERRGFDTNRHIDPAKVIHCLEIDRMITEDMRRLRDGDPIGFKPFDGYNEVQSLEKVYSMADLEEKLTDLRIKQKHSEFFTSWNTPITLKYLAARMAQLYACISPLLSQNLMVEYYRGDYNFHNVLFNYDIEYLKRQSFDSAMFWFGKRNIVPIKPNMKNFATYCKYCDYESVCLWKKQGKETCRTLGNELVSIHNGSN